MKNYTITVNGKVYDVVVEEAVTGVVRPAAPAAPKAPVAPKAAPAAPKAPATPAAAPTAPVAAPAPAATGTAGGVRIEAGAAGKIFKLEGKVGQAVKAGDPVVILEAMKMEIPVVAPQDGTIASIDVAVGDAVEAGALLATMN
ncbi:MAG: acetyl-CoA carboxylase biotin carboxyl carrier protein subunit [Lachnospiraceae bacterium]|nr:acetyl-CoA carboxylase biotin carboxyl carrier protein subunit [Lachnospiraceae bacterium]